MSKLVSFVAMLLLAVTPASAQFIRPADPGTIVRPKTTLRTTDTAKAIAFSPDGKWIASSSERVIQIWDATGNGAAPVRSMPPNPNGHTGPIYSVAFTPDGKALASAASDGKVKLWDPATGNKLAEYDAGNGVKMEGLAFSPDGRQLACSSGGTLTVLDAATLTKKAEVRVQNEIIVPIRYSADGREIITASTQHGYLRVYDSTSGRETRNWRTNDGNMHGLAHASSTGDGHVVACASTIGANPKKLEIHNGVTGAVTASYPVDADITDVRISPNGRLVAVAVLDRTVRLLDATNGHIKATFQGHGDGPISVAFSNDNTMLLSGANSSAILWSVPP
jgi:WD40 repeat protein